MSVLDQIKKQIKSSSSNFDDEFYLGEDEDAKVRFLTGFESATKVVWHDQYESNIDTPCLKHYGLECPLCKGEVEVEDDKDVRTRDLFVWTVYNYDAEKVQIFRYPANKFSPIPSLVTMYEEYGTITDRKYKIARTGTGFDINYQAVPLAKEEFDKDVEELTDEEMFEKFKTIHRVESYVKDDNNGDDGEEAEQVTELTEDDVDVPF